MRHIPIDPNDLPDPALIAAADAALDELRPIAANRAERLELFRQKADVYKAFREWLKRQSHSKCWFTEAADAAFHFEVEHYRPKMDAKNLDGSRDDGYWWLAFSWRNLRLCGNIPNRKKGGYFPLQNGCARAVPENAGVGERPYLLDPSSPTDPLLLTFDSEGKGVPSATARSNAWLTERVVTSVDRYGLDHVQLLEKRRTLRNELSWQINEYVRLLSDGGPEALGEASAILRQIREACKDRAAFSRAARAYVMELGHEFGLDMIASN